ncbi:hypothetical protein FKF97_03015 [Clostridium perfringens]|nr:hypothetical protein [Clostridium perfringens]
MTLKNILIGVTLTLFSVTLVAITIKKLVFSRKSDSNKIKNLTQNANNSKNVNQAGRDLHVK